MSFFALSMGPLGYGVSAPPAAKSSLSCDKCKKKKKGGTTLRAPAPNGFQVMNMDGLFPDAPAVAMGCGEEDEVDEDLSCSSCKRKKREPYTPDWPKIVPIEEPSAMNGGYPVMNGGAGAFGMVRGF
jgi:hypothetical protein